MFKYLSCFGFVFINNVFLECTRVGCCLRLLWSIVAGCCCRATFIMALSDCRIALSDCVAVGLSCQTRSYVVV